MDFFPPLMAIHSGWLAAWMIQVKQFDIRIVYLIVMYRHFNDIGNNQSNLPRFSNASYDHSSSYQLMTNLQHVLILFKTFAFYLELQLLLSGWHADFVENLCLDYGNLWCKKNADIIAEDPTSICSKLTPERKTRSLLNPSGILPRMGILWYSIYSTVLLRYANVSSLAQTHGVL